MAIKPFRLDASVTKDLGLLGVVEYVLALDVVLAVPGRPRLVHEPNLAHSVRLLGFPIRARKASFDAPFVVAFLLSLRLVTAPERSGIHVPQHGSLALVRQGQVLCLGGALAALGIGPIRSLIDLDGGRGGGLGCQGRSLC